jgi:hypothetical protein
MMRGVTPILAIFLLLSASCGPGSKPKGPDHGTNVPCEEETRKDVYTPGLEKQGDTLETQLLAIDPEPADVGRNDWVLAVVGPDDQRIEGCTITARPWMIEHNHGTSPATVDSVAGAQSGEYELTKLNLFMSGLWDVQLTIECSGDPEEVSYKFCLEG